MSLKQITAEMRELRSRIDNLLPSKPKMTLGLDEGELRGIISSGLAGVTTFTTTTPAYTSIGTAGTSIWIGGSTTSTASSAFYRTGNFHINNSSLTA